MKVIEIFPDEKWSFGYRQDKSCTVDDEVLSTVKCKPLQYLFKRKYMFIYIV